LNPKELLLSLFFFFLSFFVVLGFELRDSCLPGSLSLQLEPFLQSYHCVLCLLLLHFLSRTLTPHHLWYGGGRGAELWWSVEFKLHHKHLPLKKIG
jgi:hypothetical protein